MAHRAFANAANRAGVTAAAAIVVKEIVANLWILTQPNNRYAKL